MLWRRKGPPTFPWCQKVGDPFHALLALPNNSFRVRFAAHFVASLVRYIQSMRNMAPTRNSGPEITT